MHTLRHTTRTHTHTHTHMNCMKSVLSSTPFINGVYFQHQRNQVEQNVPPFTKIKICDSVTNLHKIRKTLVRKRDTESEHVSCGVTWSHKYASNVLHADAYRNSVARVTDFSSSFVVEHVTDVGYRFYLIPHSFESERP